MASPFLGSKYRATTAAGLPLAGGKVYSYAAGTLTPLPTYATEEGAAGTGNVNTNPTILDSNGRANIFIPEGVAYRFITKTSAGVLVEDVDNVVVTTGGDGSIDLRAELLSASGAGKVGVASGSYPAGSIGKWVNDHATSIGAAVTGWIQAGAGAATRTVQSKLRDAVSVKDFGAVGDGVADDTAAIQAAIDYLNPYVYAGSFNYKQGGGTVRFPRGMYLITNTIRLPAHVVLEGEGPQTYQSPTLATQTTDGSIIYAASSMTGKAAIDSAGYDTGTGLRYTSLTPRSNANYVAGLMTYTEGCGLRNIGVLCAYGTVDVGVRLMGSAAARLNNVSINGFKTGLQSIACWNVEYTGMFVCATQIPLFMLGNNIAKVSGTFDGYVVLGSGNGVSSGNKPSWWDSIDTVYGTTNLYVLGCNAIEFSSVCTQHGVRALYSNSSRMHFGTWYCEDFQLNNPQAVGYITGAALLTANNGSVSSTPVTSNAASTIVVSHLYSDSNGNTLADSLYNSNITILAFSQPGGGNGVGILYGTHTSTGQRLVLGEGVIRNTAFPDVGYDARLTYLTPAAGTWTPTATNLGGSSITLAGKWILRDNVYFCDVVITGTALTATATTTLLSTPFDGTLGVAAPVRASVASVATASLASVGCGLFKTDANLYLPTIASTTQIVASFQVFAV